MLHAERLPEQAALEEKASFMQKWVGAYQQFVATLATDPGLIDPAGVLVAGSQPDDSIGKLKLDDRDYFKAAIGGKAFISEPLIARTTGNQFVAVAIPVKRDGQVVGESSTRIRDLEKLSAQIGAITDAISGIADQTNLLALNAAIEADRAMESGTAEVENGTQLAAEAGRSLNEILETVGTAADEVGAIAQEAARVQLDARNVVRAFDSLAAVAEENTAATEEMAAGTMGVTRAVDRIAGVSQENAAATEQVSASVEEMTASAAEMASSAEGLSRIAEDLLQQVARFKV